MPPKGRGRKESSKPCRKTCDELHEMFKEADYGENHHAFQMYFFRGSDYGDDVGQTDKLVDEFNANGFAIQVDDRWPRCKECGRKIREHDLGPPIEAAPTDEETVAAYVKMCLDPEGQSDPKVPTTEGVHCRKRVGNGVDREVLATIDSIYAHGFQYRSLTSQHTEALVLVAASGVGKTFCVLSFPVVAPILVKKDFTGLKDVRFLLAYVGFNISQKLTDAEKELFRIACIKSHTDNLETHASEATEHSGTEAVPILDLAVWRSLISSCLQLKGVELPFPVEVSFARDSVKGFYEFEKRAFEVIGFALQLFWNSNPVMAEARAAFIRNNRRFNNVFGFDGCFPCFRCSMEQSKSHYHPFMHHKDGHDDACKGGLSPLFSGTVEVMQANDVVLFWTGGDAPLDFVLLKRDATGQKCHARYADAKHKESEGANASITTDAKELPEKARMVHDGLTRELRNQFNLTLDPSYKVGLVTNTKTSFTSVHCDDGTEVFVLGPSTFVFEPFTGMLYHYQRAKKRQPPHQGPPTRLLLESMPTSV